MIYGSVGPEDVTAYRPKSNGSRDVGGSKGKEEEEGSLFERFDSTSGKEDAATDVQRSVSLTLPCLASPPPLSTQCSP